MKSEMELLSEISLDHRSVPHSKGIGCVCGESFYEIPEYMTHVEQIMKSYGLKTP